MSTVGSWAELQKIAYTVLTLRRLPSHRVYKKCKKLSTLVLFKQVVQPLPCGIIFQHCRRLLDMMIPCGMQSKRLYEKEQLAAEKSQRTRKMQEEKRRSRKPTLLQIRGGAFKGGG